MAALPFIPGNSFSDPTKSRYHVSQTLSFKNGYPLTHRPKLGVGGDPLPFNQLNESELDELANSKPTLYTYGGNPTEPAPVEFVPAYVAFDKKVASNLATLSHGHLELHPRHEEGSNGEKVVLDGRHFGELVARHVHGHHLHIFIFASYGHTFSNQLYSYVQKGCPGELNSLIAITYFTSEASPTSWDVITTAGNGNVEVTRELGDFIKSNIEPNSAYKSLEGKIKPHCIIL